MLVSQKLLQGNNWISPHLSPLSPTSPACILTLGDREQYSPLNIASKYTGSHCQDPFNLSHDTRTSVFTFTFNATKHIV